VWIIWLLLGVVVEERQTEAVLVLVDLELAHHYL
jgi:hypothetical protein